MSDHGHKNLEQCQSLKLKLEILEESEEIDCIEICSTSHLIHLAPVYDKIPLAAIPEGLKVLYFNDSVDRALAITGPELYAGLLPNPKPRASFITDEKSSSNVKNVLF
jgi:hypothetical protein